MFIQFLILILGFVLLISGATFLIKGASNIAKKFHISEILIGLTIVSLGTTLPELIVSIVSATSGNTDMALGNVIGSNLFNLLFILGVITVLKPIQFEKVTIRKNLPLLLLLTYIIFILGIGPFSSTKLILNYIDGTILLIIAIIYFAIPIIQFIKQKNNSKDTQNTIENNINISIVKNIFYIIAGGVALKFGGDFAVNSSSNIALFFNIPERVIGLTIVALGTSLPELITSIIAILKGNEDIAEGNIIGACIINSTLVLGAGSIICNIPVSISYIKDLVLLFSCILLIWFFGFNNKDNIFKRINGLIILSIYLIYSIRLFI